MNRQSLIIPHLTDDEVQTLRTILKESGFADPFLIDDLQKDDLFLLNMLNEPSGDYKGIKRNVSFVHDPEVWNQVPEQVKVHFIRYLSYLANKYHISRDDYLPPVPLFNQSPPPSPGFMKDIVTITGDFDTSSKYFNDDMD